MSGQSTSSGGAQLFAVELRTTRWDVMVGWYRDQLGLRCLVRIPEDRYALLAGGGMRLAILGRDGAGESSGRWSLAVEVDDLAAALRELGLTDRVEGSEHAEGFVEAAVEDPDGNRVKLFAWQQSQRERHTTSVDEC